MVLIESLKITGQQAATNCNLSMDSGRRICYVAPRKYSALLSSDSENIDTGLGLTRKLSGSNGNGGALMRQTSGKIEKNVEMFEGKRVLEIGFCTGLHSVFAFANGASSVTLHSLDATTLNSFVKPTLRRNNVPRNRSKFSSGDLESFKMVLNNQKFDVILAAELISTDESEFEAIHDMLNAALAPNGIVLFSARPYYDHCSGSLPTFLDLVKMKGCFDADIRWTSTKTDVAPRKVVQLNRSIR
uniref:Uncharacterized protein n=1 Tax=Ditylenchus dipsaci TaxID=166011 RepID=A0A915CQC3_9BILA